jgi:type I restriction enzyme S subunit
MTADEQLLCGDIPWPTVRFGDVVRQVKDSVDPRESGLERYVAGDHMDTDDVHLRRWGDIGDDYLGPAFRRHFRAGQVLYGSRRTYLRKVAFADFDGICANTTFVCEPAGSCLLPQYLVWVMQTERFHAHSIAQSKGSVNPYINWPDIAWFEFQLPPIDIQRRIVTVMSTADAAGERIRAAELAEHRLRHSLHFELWAKTSERRRIGALGEVVTGQTPPAKKREYWSPPEVPFVAPSDFDGSLYIAEAARSISDLGRSRARILPANAVLQVCIGATIGKAAITSMECATNQQVNAVIGLDEVDASVLLSGLLAAQGRHALRGVTGITTLPVAKKSAWQGIEVPWPDRAMRERHADLLHRAEVLRASLEAERADLRQLHRGLIEQLCDRGRDPDVQ